VSPVQQVQPSVPSSISLRIETTSADFIPGTESIDSPQVVPGVDNEPHQKALIYWPRRLGKMGVPSPVRLRILNEGIQDIKKIIHPRSKSTKISGNALMKYIQVLNFMKVQALQERNWSIRPEFILFKTREQLAKQVADGEGAGQWTSREIMKNEVTWIKDRVIKVPQRGQHPKITSLLEDESTLLAVREYIGMAGEGKSYIGISLKVIILIE